ncbi:MAG: hypothetical protein C4341_02820 [Armatimonadota bacterium]
MRTAIALLVGVEAVVAAAGQTRLAVFMGGNRVGTATITETKTSDAGIQSQMRLEMKAAGAAVEIIQIGEYSKDGTPRRKYIRQSSPQGLEMKVVTFQGTTAHLVHEVGGTRVTKSYPAPAGANIKAKSELWFHGVTPKQGETDEYHRFDMNRMEWQKVVVRYVGPGVVEVRGAKRPCHIVTLGSDMKVFLSDDGLPLRIESPGVVMEVEE